MIRRRLLVGSAIALWLIICLVAFASLAFAQGRPDLIWMRGGHARAVRSIAYSPNGELFVSGSDDGTVKIWRLSTKVLLRTIYQTGKKVLFSPDSKEVFATNSGTTANRYRAADGSRIATFNTSAGKILDIALSTDAKLLAAACDDKVVRVWKVADGSLVYTLSGFTGPVQTVAFSPNEQYIAAASGGNTFLGADDTVRIWQVSDGAAVQTLSMKMLTGVDPGAYQVAFSTDSSLLGVAELASDISALHLFATKRWNLVRSIGKQQLGGDIDCFAFSPKGNKVALPRTSCNAGCGNALRTYDVSTGNLIWETVKSNDGGAVVAFSPDGNTLASGYAGVGDTGRVIMFSNTSDGSFSAELTPPGAGGRTALLAVSPDGQSFVSRNYDHGDLLLRRDSDGSVITNITQVSGIRDEVGHVVYSPDGTLLATSGFSSTASQTILIRMSNGSVVQKLSTPGSTNSSFSPDGRYLAIEGSGFSKILRVADLSEVVTLSSQGKLRFSPDGKWLAINRDLYRTSDWSYAKTLPDPGFVGLYAMAFSPDSRTFAIGGGNAGTIFFPASGTVLYDVETNTKLRSLVSNTDVRSLAFSPDGRVLATGDLSSHLDFWRVSDGVILRRYDVETGNTSIVDDSSLRALAFTPDGKLFLYGRTDGTMAAAWNPFRDGLFPERGGNTGPVTVQIGVNSDFPAADGATVTLRDGVHPDITAPAVAIAKGLMQVTFDLKGAAVGVRDVILAPPGGVIETRPKAFTIEPGPIAKIQVVTDLQGPAGIRAGRQQTYYVNVQNLSAVNSSGHIGVWVNLPLYMDGRLEGAPGEVTRRDTDTRTILVFKIPSIEALATKTYRLIVTPPPGLLDFTAFTLFAGANVH